MKKYMSINEAISALNSKKNLKEDFSLSYNDYESEDEDSYYIIPQADVEAGVEETYNEIAAKSIQELRRCSIDTDWTNEAFGEAGGSFIKVFYDHHNRSYDLHAILFSFNGVEHYVYHAIHSGKQVADIYKEFIDYQGILDSVEDLGIIQTHTTTIRSQNIQDWYDHIAQEAVSLEEIEEAEIIEY